MTCSMNNGFTCPGLQPSELRMSASLSQRTDDSVFKHAQRPDRLHDLLEEAGRRCAAGQPDATAAAAAAERLPTVAVRLSPFTHDHCGAFQCLMLMHGMYGTNAGMCNVGTLRWAHVAKRSLV